MKILADKKEWQEAKNILCIRLDSLGDILMITPALRALKESLPGRRITLLTSQSGATVVSLIPEVDETILYNAPWMKATQTPDDSQPEFQMIERLKECRFDAAVIFTTFSQSPLPAALLTYMADIPLRLAHCRENPYYLLTDWLPETDDFGQADIRHEVRRQLDLVASVGSTPGNESLSLRVSQEAVEEVSQVLSQIDLDIDRPWLILHPGATAPSRRYPPESYSRVAEILNREYGFQILFTGTEPEIELIDFIRSNMQADSFSLAGRLGIEEFSALISIAPLLLCNNSGPVHIAAALGTPVVDLYALTNPQHTPWNVPHRTLYHDVPCRFCYKSICPMGHHNCLRLVSPESVVKSVLELLSELKEDTVSRRPAYPAPSSSRT